MKADHNRELISLIIRDIIHESANRSVRGGLSHLALGFLNEISHHLAAGIDALRQPTAQGNGHRRNR